MLVIAFSTFLQIRANYVSDQGLHGAMLNCPFAYRVDSGAKTRGAGGLQ